MTYNQKFEQWWAEVRHRITKGSIKEDLLAAYEAGQKEARNEVPLQLEDVVS